jgi:hypothetical protein
VHTFNIGKRLERIERERQRYGERERGRDLK